MTHPPYTVPTMEEIRALPWNGRNVISTFAGGGGSSTGYRMAGYRVLYANEFVPAAAETYALNAAPYTIVDQRDIREVTGADLLAQLGIARGELDVLDGSPPCASFSTAGKRSKGWGKVSTYSDTKQRTDDLFYEYARLVRDLQPKVFVAENVSGLVKGVAKGYFRAILAALQEAGYVVSARLLNAAQLGVPQARQRVIFVGVRKDLGIAPAHPKPRGYVHTVREVLPYIESLTKDSGGFPAWDATDRPAPTILSETADSHYVIRAPGPTVDPETGQDITIGRYAIGREWENVKPGASSDKYLNLQKSHPDRPSPTVTATAGQIAAAGVTHYDSPRKFTLQELRAICGFPPDYQLAGTYSQRWERLGRSVPPLMMKAVAETVRDEVLACVD